jgi:hypothetical protein
MSRLGAVFRAGVRAFDAARLLMPLRVPGLPPIPRLLAYPALLEPRLVPYFLRWKAATGGLGLVVSCLCAEESRSALADDPMSTNGTSVGRVLQSIGEEHGRALRTQLRYGRSPIECARAVALANRLFGIRAQVVRGSFGEARVVTPGCPWSRSLEWGTGPCGAFSRYEAGLTAGLNPGIRLRYESKRTRGDDRCVGVYSWRSVAGDR